MNTVIDSGYGYEVRHHKGTQKYRGCTCSNPNCDCAINEQPEYDFYTVKKTVGKIRTTNCKTLDVVATRIKQIQSAFN